MAHWIVLLFSLPLNVTTIFIESYFSVVHVKTNVRLSIIPSMASIFSAEESWMSSSPFSNRDSVGVLTPASWANLAWVSFCCLRLLFASSIRAGQLMQNFHSIFFQFSLLSCLSLIVCQSHYFL